MIESVRIPDERVAILIGQGGSVKKHIEKATKTSIRVSLADGVEIEGKDVLGVMKAKNTVKAIGRGFSPEHAFLLLEDDYEIYTVSLKGENRNTINRLMGRVIGRSGNTKLIIEQKTGCHISVYGKTVSVIGHFDQIDKASQAVELLLSGKKHGYVYSVIDNRSPAKGSESEF